MAEAMSQSVNCPFFNMAAMLHYAEHHVVEL
jgi:hypothetical protein